MTIEAVDRGRLVGGARARKSAGPCQGREDQEPLLHRLLPSTDPRSSKKMLKPIEEEVRESVGKSASRRPMSISGALVLSQRPPRAGKWVNRVKRNYTAAIAHCRREFGAESVGALGQRHEGGIGGKAPGGKVARRPRQAAAD